MTSTIAQTDSFHQEPLTLAARLQMTSHISPLLAKARFMGLGQPEDLEKLAVSRGLRYYDAHGDSTKDQPPAVQVIGEKSGRSFSNVELALALLSPSAPYSLLRLRMGAAMLAAEGNRPEHIIRLARQERSERIVRHIAQCGMEAEPGNPFWTALMDSLPLFPPMRPDALPHLTRFVAMTGLSRAGKKTSMMWIRPIRASGS